MSAPELGQPVDAVEFQRIAGALASLASPCRRPDCPTVHAVLYVAPDEDGQWFTVHLHCDQAVGVR